MHRRAAKRRQGDRGSVALIGPTRSGKTVLLSGGIVGWDGPVVALSVKRDLYNATASARAGRGELAMFDPGGGTKLPTARWTPLRDVTTASGAARAGKALAAAIPRTGVEGGDFWAQHGETFVVAYMALAGLSRRLPGTKDNPREPLTIQRLARWAYLHVGLTEPAVHELVKTGLSSDDLEVRLLATNAVTKLRAFHDEDPKIRDSIYATARLAFEAWTEPSVGHSATLDPRPAYNSIDTFEHRPRYLDLEWLMSGGPNQSNTLYLSAPSIEFARLAPVLGGLLGDLRGQLHEWDIEGTPLEKPLLFVIDEAGQLELAWLPEEVSTIAGLGGMFVTCWQSKSQISHRYGTLADAVLGGHRSKVFFSGTDDLSTLDYASRIAGTVHLAQRGWSAETTGGRKTVSEHAQREDLLPAHVIRQMEPQQAVLVHGTLPPVHLQSVLWWQDRQLRKLVPTDAKGRPVAPTDTGTCPLTDEPAAEPTPTLDAATVQEAKDHLPAAKAVVTSTAVVPRPARPQPDHVSFQQLTLVGGTGSAETEGIDTAPVDPPNRSAMICHSCGRWLAVGQGTVSKRGHETLARCSPGCPTAS
jgi:type IV secretion system protein VirD4